jgi:hypothetical protein
MHLQALHFETQTVCRRPNLLQVGRQRGPTPLLLLGAMTDVRQGAMTDVMMLLPEITLSHAVSSPSLSSAQEHVL